MLGTGLARRGREGGQNSGPACADKPAFASALKHCFVPEYSGQKEKEKSYKI
jgi:hypothetical protein